MTRTHRTAIAVAVTVAATMVSLNRISLAADEPPAAKPKSRPKLYDTSADGEAQIRTALAVAKAENKRVLLQFGANWCGWCHKLHDLFKAEREIARELLFEYIMVLIDVDQVDGKPHNRATNEKYGNPVRFGLPVLVVLDADGKALTTQDTGKLEAGDHHDPKKVLEFLRKWRAEPQSADDVLKSALSTAKRERKQVLLTFGAPWCGWCHRLEAYLRQEKVARILANAFVISKIDVDRMTGGKAIDKRYRIGTDGGLPFFVILSAEGQRVADSYGPNGNVGFPAAPEELEHFVKVVRKAAPSISEPDLKTLEQLLKSEKR